MGVEAVIATQVIDTTTVGRSLMTAADAAAARTAISFDESVDDRVSALLVAGTNITITYNDAANTLTIAASGGGLSGTGSLDNAALRADGTGGATLQNSNLLINDNLTASPNNTVNHLCLETTGGTTNVSVSVKPKGSGAFCLNAPDGSASGGGARGAYAVDLTLSRFSSSWIASGDYSFSAGQSAKASGLDSVSLGKENTASGQCGFATGLNTQAQALCTATFGRESFASASYAFAHGYNSSATQFGQYASAAGKFANDGDAQAVRFVVRNKTTNATPTTLFIDGSSTRLAITSGKILFADVLISGIKSDGSVAACYKRKVAIKNVGGTTAIVGSVETIGTDIEDSAGCDVALTADNTNDALQISVTGIAAETWRWVAVVEGLEIAYGT
jgi:hypothetical protein